MDAGAIRGWLLQQPRPSLLRLSKEDAAVNEIECANRSWASVAQSVAAIEPELIEAFDSSKKLLRAMRPAELEPASSSTTAATSSAGKEDPETARFRLFATLMAKAYEHSTDVAFTKLVELYEAQARAQRDTNKEVDGLMRLLRKEYEDKLRAIEEGGSDPLEQMVNAFATGTQQNQAEQQQGIVEAAASAAAAAAAEAAAKKVMNHKPKNGKH